MNILSPKLLLALLIVSIAGFTNSAKSEIIVIDNFNTEMEAPDCSSTIMSATHSKAPKTSETSKAAPSLEMWI